MVAVDSPESLKTVQVVPGQAIIYLVPVEVVLRQPLRRVDGEQPEYLYTAYLE